jgi:putative membrane protein
MAMTSALVSSWHLLTLALGLGAIIWRAVLFQRLAEDPQNKVLQKRLFLADNLWGLAAAFWIGSGLWRLLGSLEKPSHWYLNYGVFWFKMGLFGLVFCLELSPMISLIRARITASKGPWIPSSPNLKRHALISKIEAGITISIVIVASLMAHGVFYSKY